VAEGVKELVARFRSDRLSREDFMRYRRLAEIKRLMSEGRLKGDLTWA